MQKNKIKVAINRHIVDKNIGGNTYYMANEWENVELTIDDFINFVAVEGPQRGSSMDKSSEV